jgi:hypothetical protein
LGSHTAHNFSGGEGLQGCYHSDSGIAHVVEDNRVYIAVRWNMTTDFGVQDSPTHLVVFRPSDGHFISRSQLPLAYIPWGLGFDNLKQRLLGVWVNKALQRHEVVEIDPVRGNHTLLLALPQDPYCTTQQNGDCKQAAPSWGKTMMDQELRRWTLPMSSQLGWNLTLVHVNIDQFLLSEVPVQEVGYGSKYSTVSNTALDTGSKYTVSNTALDTRHSERRFIVALCAKCTERTGDDDASICMQSTSKLVKIDAETGSITEVPGPTGIAWTTGAANSVYDDIDSVMYYVQYTEAAFSQRHIVALPMNGSGPIASQPVGSDLPPDLLLLVLPSERASSNNTRIGITNADIANPNITSTIASWTSLSSSIAAAAGKAVTLTLSTPFDMTGFQSGSSIHITTAQTAITIVGNGAIFDAGGKDNFFDVYQAVALVMSNVTLQNGNSGSYNAGGAIIVVGTVTLSGCIFSGNAAPRGGGGGGGGGAIHVDGGTVTLADCMFSGNTAGYAGGALYFGSNSNGLLKNCSLLGTISPKNNDIACMDTTANVTFACADGEVGTPVQMSGTEITKLPAPTCTAQTYSCYNGGKANWKCVPDNSSQATPAQCDEVCAP